MNVSPILFGSQVEIDESKRFHNNNGTFYRFHKLYLKLEPKDGELYEQGFRGMHLEFRHSVKRLPARIKANLIDRYGFISEYIHDEYIPKCQALIQHSPISQRRKNFFSKLLTIYED